MVDTKTPADLNPNAAPIKHLEMAVRRALGLIEAFEALPEGQDWQDVPGSTYRKILGPRYEHGTLFSECYTRWKDGSLYYQILEMAENLPPSVLDKKEVKDGLRKVRDHVDS